GQPNLGWTLAIGKLRAFDLRIERYRPVPDGDEGNVGRHDLGERRRMPQRVYVLGVQHTATQGFKQQRRSCRSNGRNREQSSKSDDSQESRNNHLPPQHLLQSLGNSPTTYLLLGRDEIIRNDEPFISGLAPSGLLLHQSLLAIRSEPNPLLAVQSLRVGLL